MCVEDGISHIHALKIRHIHEPTNDGIPRRLGRECAREMICKGDDIHDMQLMKLTSCLFVLHNGAAWSRTPDTTIIMSRTDSGGWIRPLRCVFVPLLGMFSSSHRDNLCLSCPADASLDAGGAIGRVENVSFCCQQSRHKGVPL